MIVLYHHFRKDYNVYVKDEIRKDQHWKPAMSRLVDQKTVVYRKVI